MLLWTQEMLNNAIIKSIHVPILSSLKSNQKFEYEVACEEEFHTYESVQTSQPSILTFHSFDNGKWFVIVRYNMNDIHRPIIKS